jgi:chemotaxis protein CheD
VAAAFHPASGPAPRPAQTPALPGVYLHPGQVFLSVQPTAVTTILGSCVAVGLWDHERGVGGLCHYLLPESPKAQAPSPRFADAAVGQLLQGILALGARPGAVVAKVFGGACVLEAMRRAGHLGSRNVQRARALLAERGIRILAEDVEGDRGRKLVFHTHDGSAWVKLLSGDAPCK